MKAPLVFKQFVILATLSLPPSNESSMISSRDTLVDDSGSWSSCSRSCNEGVQWRQTWNGTREYRVCVSPPCPMSHSINTISVNWADKLCAKHRLGYQYGQWQSFVRSDSPCMLMCKDVTRQGLYRHLSASVMDGARCDHGSYGSGSGGQLSVCLSGRCQSVGCDLVIGSGATLDECGECGGRGQSCKHQKYVSRFSWISRPSSQCSVSCGGEGYQSVTYVCADTVTRTPVDLDLCDERLRPRSTQVQCGDNDCDKISRSQTREAWSVHSDVLDSDNTRSSPPDQTLENPQHFNENITVDYLETASGVKRIKPVFHLTFFILVIYGFQP